MKAFNAGFIFFIPSKQISTKSTGDKSPFCISLATYLIEDNDDNRRSSRFIYNKKYYNVVSIKMTRYNNQSIWTQKVLAGSLNPIKDL
jgi:hypothetical protein